MVEIQPLGAGRYRVFQTPSEYQLLIDSAPHHRAKPPMKIMALSARVGTASEATPGQILQRNGEHFMRVEGKDSTDRYQETKARNIWLPGPIYEDINNFIENRNLDDDTPICDVGKRQLQNWVKEAAENAATSSGVDDFNKISAHDLRRYFGTHFLIRLKIDPQIVTQLGGWISQENMYEYLLFPNDLIVHRLAKQGYIGNNPLHISGTNPVHELNANFDTVEKILSQEGEEVETEIKERVKNLALKFDSFEVREMAGTQTPESVSSIDGDKKQSSFKTLFDDNI